MKKTMIAAALVAATASVAMADGQITIWTNPGGIYDGSDQQGGAFRIQTVSGFNGFNGGNGNDNNNFFSFCLEVGEHITNGTTYNTVVAGGAYYGGNGTLGDVPSDITKRIYKNFRLGGSFGGTFGTLSSSSETTAIQYAIWSQEGERNLGNTAEDTLAAQLIAWATTANGLAVDISDVGVLQLFNLNGTRAQDQLALVPLPPAAWAGLSTLAGVAGLSIVRRRKHTAQ
jgi:hypothetical protein